jgi:tetratricopeptide (TPR) repeat protein
LGFYYERAEQPQKAESAYKDALRLEEPLAAEHPAVPEYQLSLAKTQNGLALLYTYKLKRLAEADVLYQKSIAIGESLVRANAKVPAIAMELGGTHCNRGGLLVELRDYAGATKAYLRAKELLEEVLRKDDHNGTARQYLLNVHTGLGGVYRSRGQKTEAVTAYRKVAEMWERLARDNPGVAENTLWAGGAYCNLGNRLQENNKHDAAVSSYSRAIQLLQVLLQNDPDNVQARLFLANSLGGRGLTLSKFLQRHAEAIKELDRAVCVAQALNQDWLGAVRTCALARSGDYHRAVAQAQYVSTRKSAEDWLLVNCAYAHALAAAAVLKDGRLAAAEQDRLSDRYAGRAVALLSQTARTGYFKTPAEAAELKTDPDLDALRSRQDFKKLLMDLEKAIKTSD